MEIAASAAFPLSERSGTPRGRVTSLRAVGCVLATASKTPRAEARKQRGGAGQGWRSPVGAGPTSARPTKPGSCGEARRRAGRLLAHLRPSTPEPSGHHERPSRGPEPSAAGGAGQGEGASRVGGLGRKELLDAAHPGWSPHCLDGKGTLQGIFGSSSPCPWAQWLRQTYTGHGT